MLKLTDFATLTSVAEPVHHDGLISVRIADWLNFETEFLSGYLTWPFARRLANGRFAKKIKLLVMSGEKRREE